MRDALLWGSLGPDILDFEDEPSLWTVLHSDSMNTHKNHHAWSAHPGVDPAHRPPDCAPGPGLKGFPSPASVFPFDAPRARLVSLGITSLHLLCTGGH